MKIYTFYTGSNDINNYYPTLGKAIAAAKEAITDHYEDIEIECNTVVKLTKENLCDILNSNGGSWSTDSKVVKVIRKTQ